MLSILIWRQFRSCAFEQACWNLKFRLLLCIWTRCCYEGTIVKGKGHCCVDGPHMVITKSIEAMVEHSCCTANCSLCKCGDNDSRCVRWCSRARCIPLCTGPCRAWFASWLFPVMCPRFCFIRGVFVCIPLFRKTPINLQLLPIYHKLGFTFHHLLAISVVELLILRLIIIIDGIY